MWILLLSLGRGTLWMSLVWLAGSMVHVLCILIPWLHQFPRGVITSVITTRGEVILFLDLSFSASLTLKLYTHLFGTVLFFVCFWGRNSLCRPETKHFPDGELGCGHTLGCCYTEGAYSWQPVPWGKKKRQNRKEELKLPLPLGSVPDHIGNYRNLCRCPGLINQFSKLRIGGQGWAAVHRIQEYCSS